MIAFGIAVSWDEFNPVVGRYRASTATRWTNSSARFSRSVRPFGDNMPDFNVESVWGWAPVRCLRSGADLYPRANPEEQTPRGLLQIAA